MSGQVYTPADLRALVAHARARGVRASVQAIVQVYMRSCGRAGGSADVRDNDDGEKTNKMVRKQCKMVRK